MARQTAVSPTRTTLLALLLPFLLLTPHTLADSACTTYCTDFGTNLQTCSSKYGNSVLGSGSPVTSAGVECVCVGDPSATETGAYDISQCYECGLLTGDDLTLLELWLITCATGIEDSLDDAVACWNTQLVNGETGPPCYQPDTSGSSSTVSGEQPTETPTPTQSDEFPPATSTLGGGGGGETTTAGPESTDTAFGGGGESTAAATSSTDVNSESSAPTSSSGEGFSASVGVPTSTPSNAPLSHSSSLATSTKQQQSSSPPFSSNPAFSQQPTTQQPTPSPTPTAAASLAERVYGRGPVSMLACVVGVLVGVVLF